MNLRLSNGEKALIVYFSIFYFMPFFIDTFIGLNLKNLLIGDPNFVLGFLFALAYLALFLLLSRKVRLDVRIKCRLCRFIYHDATIMIMAAVFFVASLRFYSSFGLEFRYNNRFSNSGFLPIIVFVLKTYVNVAALILIACRQIRLKYAIYFAITAVSIFLSTTGSTDVILILVNLYGLILHTRTQVTQLAVYLINRLDILLIIALVPIMGAIGIINKSGADYIQLVSLSDIISIVFNRLSYHFYSLSHHVNTIGDNLLLWWDALLVILVENFNRLCVLLQIPIEPQPIKTIARMNFLQISPDFGDSVGASPGFLGSIFFLPGGIFAVLVHMMLFRNIVSSIDTIIGAYRKYNIFILIYLFTIVQSFGDSLMDSFNIFSAGFTQLIFLVTGSMYVRRYVIHRPA